MRNLLFALTVLLMTNCDKTEYVTMVYEERGCFFKWEHEGNESIVIEGMKSYFETTHDITFKNAFLTKETPENPCEACHCLSGRKFFVEVDEAFVQTLQDENFYLQ